MNGSRTFVRAVTLAFVGSLPWAAACAAPERDNEADAALFEERAPPATAKRATGYAGGRDAAESVRQ